MRPRTTLAFGNLFSSAHFYLTLYILAPYLATFMHAKDTGLIVSLGALITLALFPLAPHLVRKIGAKRFALTFASVQALLLLTLVTNPEPAAAIVLTALVCAIPPLIAYALDLLLEATVAEEGSTGRIRTTYLTAGNLALLVSPLLVSWLLGESERYAFVFFAASFSLIPFVSLFLAESLPEGTSPQTESLWSTLLCVCHSRDLCAIIAAQFVLQIFYHLTFYIPLYLHTELGMPWSELGWVFALMLLPFVLVEYPAGALADRWLGDKEMLASGFLITGATFALIGFIHGATPIAVVLAILIATRVGAALVESMTEGHFFRQVSEADAGTVGIFRMMRPLAALAAPLVGTLILSYTDYALMFASMGALIAFTGLSAALLIRDVR